MARYKGFLDAAVKGVKAIDDLKDGDKVLISEAVHITDSAVI